MRSVYLLLCFHFTINNSHLSKKGTVTQKKNILTPFLEIQLAGIHTWEKGAHDLPEIPTK